MRLPDVDGDAIEEVASSSAATSNAMTWTMRSEAESASPNFGSRSTGASGAATPPATPRRLPDREEERQDDAASIRGGQQKREIRTPKWKKAESVARAKTEWFVAVQSLSGSLQGLDTDIKQLIEEERTIEGEKPYLSHLEILRLRFGICQAVAETGTITLPQ